MYFDWRLITLQYCIGFVIHQHESATGVHVFPILNSPIFSKQLHKNYTDWQCTYLIMNSAQELILDKIF